MFHRGRHTVQQLNASARLVSDMELRLNRNITSSVARSLQELSSAFRSSQSAYLKSTHNFVMVLVIKFKCFDAVTLMVGHHEGHLAFKQDGCSHSEYGIRQFHSYVEYLL